MKNKTLVIGLACGYKYRQLAPFINSLKSTGYSGDIVWFISKTDKVTMSKLKQQGVILIEYNHSYPYFNDKRLITALPNGSDQNFSPNSLRFIFYKVFLDLYPDKYDRILHADTRDVYFQDDIFKKKWQNGTYCFLEDESELIGINKYNAYWVKVGFGQAVLDEIAQKPISCCGVVYGHTNYFVEYVDEMVKWITKIPPSTGVLEQGIHNYIIYFNKIKNIIIISDDEGDVSTLTTFKRKIKIDENNKIINNYDCPVSIVHQYDRHLFLLWRWNKYEFFNKTINILKRKLLILSGRNFNEKI